MGVAVREVQHKEPPLKSVEELQQLVGELLATTEAVDMAQVMLQSFRRRLEQCIEKKGAWTGH